MDRTADHGSPPSPRPPGRGRRFAVFHAALVGASLVAVPSPPLVAQRAQASPPRATGLPADPSPHRTGVARVEGVGIEFLDWGGAGPALVFVPGFGNSAHVFDDFAPRFTDRHRVVGVTRVGFGGSDQPVRGGYTIAERTGQLRAVLDSLGLRRVVLVGHSLGGDEITAFATTHPERTAGVIYLDAALDHREAMAQEERLGAVLAGLLPNPEAADLVSASAYAAFLQRTGGVAPPLGEVLATNRFDAAGTVVGRRTPGRVMEAIVAETPALRYRGVRAPALALYAEWTPITLMFPLLATDTAAAARTTAALDSVLRPWELRERARFVREVPQARVIAFPSHHYQFLSHPTDTERLMRAFLASLGEGPR